MKSSGIGALLAGLFLSCTSSQKAVILPSYRFVYATESNARFIEEHHQQYGCIGVASRSLQNETIEKMEERARGDYAEHCRGNIFALNYARNEEITVAYQPFEE